MENNYEPNPDMDSEYGIDLFEIYDYEVNLFHKIKIKHEELLLVYYFVEEFFLKKKPDPFIEVEYGANAPHREYIDRYLREINEFKRGIGITFCFFNRDKLYDIEGNHICISKQDVNTIDFEKLFAYSVRTYEDKLSEISPFLNFQFANNFENNSRNFHRFLEIVLTQHDILLSEKIVKFVRIWMQENPVIIHQNSAISQRNIPESIIRTFEDYKEEFTEATLEEIPENYTVVDLKISRIDIMEYFSFLLTTLDKNGELVMSKQDFIDVFKYGIAIPPQPTKQLVKLKLKGLKVGSINYAIYIFFDKYAKNVSQKKDIMNFFGYQFEYFHNRITSTAALDSWNKNLTPSIKPKKKLDFEIPDIPVKL